MEKSTIIRLCAEFLGFFIYIIAMFVILRGVDKGNYRQSVATWTAFGIMSAVNSFYFIMTFLFVNQSGVMFLRVACILIVFILNIILIIKLIRIRGGLGNMFINMTKSDTYEIIAFALFLFFYGKAGYDIGWHCVGHSLILASIFAYMPQILCSVNYVKKHLFDFEPSVAYLIIAFSYMLFTVASNSDYKNIYYFIGVAIFIFLSVYTIDRSKEEDVVVYH